MIQEATQSGRTWEEIRGPLLRQCVAGKAAIVAALLLALQTLWRGAAISQGFFTQQDYLTLRDALGEGLGVQYLMAPHGEEFSPLGRLVVHTTATVGGPEWAPVAGVVIVFQLVAGLLLWAALTLLVRKRWIRVPLYAVALFTPLTLSVTLGWTSASSYWPGVVLLLVGTLGVILALREGWVPGQFVALAMVILCALTGDQALLSMLVLLFVAAAVAPAAGGVGRRLRAALLDLPWLWLAFLVAVAARVTLLLISDETSGYSPPSTSGEVFDTALALARKVIVGLVGGPWEGQPQAGSLKAEFQWTTALAVLLCLALALPLLRAVRRPGAGVALIGVVVVVAGTLLLLVFRDGGIQGSALVVRSAAALVLPLCLLAAAALPEARLSPAQGGGSRPLRAPTSRGVTAVVLSVLLVASTAASTRLVLPGLKNTDDRAYVTALREELSTDPTLVLIDGRPPAGILHPWFGAEARVSTVTDAFAETPSFDIPSERLRLVDAKGRLQVVELESPVFATTLGDDACLTAVTQSPTVLSFPELVAPGDVVLAFDYLTPVGMSLMLENGGSSLRVPLPHELGSVQVPLQGGFDTLTLSADGPGQVCLARVAVGPPTPAEPAE